MVKLAEGDPSPPGGKSGNDRLASACLLQVPGGNDGNGGLQLADSYIHPKVEMVEMVEMV